jgi:damage-control phosphatase, subfamily I
LKFRLACYPCIFKQALTALRLSTDDTALHMRALEDLMRRLRGPDMRRTPSFYSRLPYDVARDATGVKDPFAAAKAETNRLALSLLPALRRKIAAAPDPLRMALKVALSGNVIDLGIGHAFDLERDAEQITESPLTIDHYEDFARLLKGCRRLLFLCDNAGEIAFDTLLVEQLKRRCEVIACVKSGPIINDAIMEDARAVGLTDMVKVIETGSDYIGVEWEYTSPEFREAFTSADIILAKGQGNFETLGERPEELFFLLKAKCAEVAAELGVKEGGTVFMRGRAGRAGRNSG